MDLTLLDPQLAAALALFPRMDIWRDLPLSRRLIAQARCAQMDVLSPINTVVSKDYDVASYPQSAGASLSTARSKPNPARIAMDSWWWLLTW